MPGQAAVAVVILAVNVACYRTREGDVPGPRHNRQAEPVGGKTGHQLGHRRAGLRGYQPALGVDRDDPVHPSHIEHLATVVLRGIAVAAPGAPSDHASPRPPV